jgi:uncharacterized protein (DUF2384 family)
MKRSTNKATRTPLEKPAQRPSDWRDKSTKALAQEQGVPLPQDAAKLLGAGSDLWGSDEEFEEFLQGIQDRRHGPARRR